MATPKPFRQDRRAKAAARDALDPLGFWTISETEADIVRHFQPWQQPRLLEYDADLLLRRADCLAVECNHAFACRIEPGDGAQQRRFSAAGAADHGDDFAEPNFQRNTAEGTHAVRIGLTDAIETKHAIVLILPYDIFPAQQGHGGERDQPIRRLADYGERNNGGDNFRRLAELLAVDQQISQVPRMRP